MLFKPFNPSIHTHLRSPELPNIQECQTSIERCCCRCRFLYSWRICVHFFFLWCTCIPTQLENLKLHRNDTQAAVKLLRTNLWQSWRVSSVSDSGVICNHLDPTRARSVRRYQHVTTFTLRCLQSSHCTWHGSSNPPRSVLSVPLLCFVWSTLSAATGAGSKFNAGSVSDRNVKSSVPRIPSLQVELDCHPRGLQGDGPNDPNKKSNSFGQSSLLDSNNP